MSKGSSTQPGYGHDPKKQPLSCDSIYCDKFFSNYDEFKVSHVLKAQVISYELVETCEPV